MPWQFIGRSSSRYMKTFYIRVIHNCSELDTTKIPINSRLGKLILIQWWSGYYRTMKMSKLKLKTALWMNLANLEWKVWSQNNVYHIITCMCHIKKQVKWNDTDGNQSRVTYRKEGGTVTGRALDCYITKGFICGVITRICSLSTFLHVGFTALKKSEKQAKKGSWLLPALFNSNNKVNLVSE